MHYDAAFACLVSAPETTDNHRSPYSQTMEKIKLVYDTNTVSLQYVFYVKCILKQYKYHNVFDPNHVHFLFVVVCLCSLPYFRQ